jgi:hypothetical protein
MVLATIELKEIEKDFATVIREELDEKCLDRVIAYGYMPSLLEALKNVVLDRDCSLTSQQIND